MYTIVWMDGDTFIAKIEIYLCGTWMFLNERGHEGVDMLVLTRLVLFVRCK